MSHWHLQEQADRFARRVAISAFVIEKNKRYVYRFRSHTHLTISVVVDEIMFRQHEPSLLVIDRGEALLVLGAFYHESLPDDVSTF